jgi:hypothetical protein
MAAALCIPAQASAAVKTYNGAFTGNPVMKIEFEIVVKNGVKKLKSYKTVNSKDHTGGGLIVHCDEGNVTWGAQGVFGPYLKLHDNAWVAKSSSTDPPYTTTFAGQLTNGGSAASGVLKFKGTMFRAPNPNYHNCNSKFPWTATRQ